MFTRTCLRYAMWTVLVLSACAAAMRSDDFLLSYGAGPFKAQLTPSEYTRREALVDMRDFRAHFLGRQIWVSPRPVGLSNPYSDLHAAPTIFSDTLRATEPLRWFKPIEMAPDRLFCNVYGQCSVGISGWWVKVQLDSGFIAYINTRHLWNPSEPRQPRWGVYSFEPP